MGRTNELRDAARAEAFARLVDRRALDDAYRFATLMLGDRGDAEDATHDAALTAWRRFGDLRERDRFEAWFGRILHNVCRDRLRARRRSPLSLDLEPPTPATAARFASSDQAETIVRRDALGSALRTLTPEHREVVILRFYFDLTIEQIATRTATGKGTVKSRLHYALRYLRSAVESGLGERTPR
ncbi:MAG TPA: sigma-70 family RNA polymerase sigma factor [Candidatus Limnocylindrales bacterium]